MADLEADINGLQDEVEDVETANTLQDERFLVVEGYMAENSNDIDGNFIWSVGKTKCCMTESFVSAKCIESKISFQTWRPVLLRLKT